MHKQQVIGSKNVDYDITVSLDDVNHVLNGNITMQYTNNSPDALTFIWIHLWPNAYKDNNTAFAKQKYCRAAPIFILQKIMNAVISIILILK